MINFLHNVFTLSLVVAVVALTIIAIIICITCMIKLLDWLLRMLYPSKRVTKMFKDVIEEEEDDKETDGALYDRKWYEYSEDPGFRN